MIGDLLVILVVVLAAGGVGLWLGIVVLAPRLQRRIDRAVEPPELAERAPTDQPAREPDGPAD